MDVAEETLDCEICGHRFTRPISPGPKPRHCSKENCARAAARDRKRAQRAGLRAGSSRGGHIQLLPQSPTGPAEDLEQVLLLLAGLVADSELCRTGAADLVDWDDHAAKLRQVLAIVSARRLR